MSSPLFLKIILYYLTIMVLAFLINITIKMLFPIMKMGLKSTLSIFKKEKTIYVKIVSKRAYTFNDENKDSIQNYYLTFEDKDKKVYEFLVDQYYYIFYMEEEKGLLTYKGEHFIEFVRKNKNGHWD